MSKNKIESINTVILGTGGVGKSALTLQYMYGEFVQEYEPTRTDSYKKNVTTGDVTYNVSIIDSAGQEDYGFLRDSYARTADGCWCVFSLTEHDSFTSLNEFRELILRVKQHDDVTIMLIGNKLDIIEEDTSKRAVTTAEAEALAKSWNVTYLETSAKTCHNVNKMFTTLVEQIVAKQRKNHVNSKDNMQQKPKRKRCAIL